jgi:lipase chaperone LimK
VRVWPRCRSRRHTRKEIVDELSQHLDDRWRELVVNGHAPDDAARLARIELDGTQLTMRLESLRRRTAHFEADPR